jgi:hypothetical protein
MGQVARLEWVIFPRSLALIRIPESRNCDPRSAANVSCPPSFPVGYSVCDRGKSATNGREQAQQYHVGRQLLNHLVNDCE